ASASELASSASDGRLVDWVFEEQRLFDRRDRRTPDDEAEANGRALMTQALARHLGIRRVEQSPAFVDASPALRDESALAPYFELGVAAGDGRELTDDSVDRFVQFDQQLSGKSKDGFVAIRVVGDS